MPLLECSHQQVRFVGKILRALKVTFIQRAPRLLHEGLGLVEGTPLGVGERATLKLGNALRYVLLCGFNLRAASRPSPADGRFERRRFDRSRLVRLRLGRRRLGRNSASSLSLWPRLWRRGRRRGLDRGLSHLWFRRCWLFDNPRAGLRFGHR
jgi:hypothetical protein